MDTTTIAPVEDYDAQALAAWREYQQDLADEAAEEVAADEHSGIGSHGGNASTKDGSSAARCEQAMNATAVPTRPDQREGYCPGCGQTFNGERGLRSHQTARFVTLACRPASA
jgi:hypothetical protein